MFYFVFLTSLLSFILSDASQAFYLTYPEDPAKSIAVHWLENKKDKIASKMSYKKKEEGEWKSIEAKSVSLGSLRLKCCVLLDLEPDREYSFCIEGEQERYFKTLPAALTRPLVIAIGGDAYREVAPFREMNRSVAALSPDFVIMGGDIAYANRGDPEVRWYAFFLEWANTMVTQEGRVIPIVGVVGNHEIVTKKKKAITFFCDFFPYLERKSYGKLEVAKTLSFFLLDTQHLVPVEGEQTEWLKKTLEETVVPYKIAVYHEGAYPSFYPYNNKTSAFIRKCWSPLFEEHNLFVAFENHNHMFKRTYPIKAGQVGETGVVYIGDGCWSVSPRKKKDKRWYLQKRLSSHCASLLKISSEGGEVRSIDKQGKELDVWQKSLSH